MIFGYFDEIQGTPPVKLESKLLIGSSLNFTHIMIISMRPPISSFKLISQIWQNVSEELATLRKRKIGIH